MINILKPIKKFPKYLVSDKGTVYSLNSNKILKQSCDKNGYLRVGLWKDRKRYIKVIHRLVLETFVGHCPDEMQSCHNNGNKRDNRIDNLRWDTQHNNVKDSMKHGTHRTLHQYGENSANHKLTEKNVINVIHLWNTKLFKQQQIADIYGVSNGTISDIICKRTWRHLWTKKTR